jgi:hypothetical protein
VLRGSVMELNDRLSYLTRVLPDGRIAEVIPLTFGRARIIILASLESLWVQDSW